MTFSKKVHGFLQVFLQCCALFQLCSSPAALLLKVQKQFKILILTAAIQHLLCLIKIKTRFLFNRIRTNKKYFRKVKALQYQSMRGFFILIVKYLFVKLWIFMAPPLVSLTFTFG